ncbi:hypothetical protein [Streptomyces sp. NPDC002159]
MTWSFAAAVGSGEAAGAFDTVDLAELEAAASSAESLSPPQAASASIPTNAMAATPAPRRARRV